MIEGLLRIPLQRFEDERVVRRADARKAPEADAADELLAQGRDPGAPLSRARPGRPLRLLQGTARVVVLDRVDGEAFTEDIGDENLVALYIPAATRTASRR